MKEATLRNIYRYPVKSMAGESLDNVQLGERGLIGDRAWALRDETRGGIRGGKRFPELMGCTASYPEDPPAEGSITAQVTLPDGRLLRIDDPQTPAALGDLVGHPVTVWPLLPAEQLDHYRRGAPMLEDAEAEFRRVFARTADEPLPDVSKFPEFLREFESPPGTYFDAFPLLLMTTESLATMQRAAPDSVFDRRRFRPNLLIETGLDDDFPELAWIGRRLKIGSVELEINMECPRCVMTTHGFDELPKDPGIMRSLVKHADGNLGVYASTRVSGSVSVGDTIELID